MRFETISFRVLLSSYVRTSYVRLTIFSYIILISLYHFWRGVMKLETIFFGIKLSRTFVRTLSYNCQVYIQGRNRTVSSDNFWNLHDWRNPFKYSSLEFYFFPRDSVKFKIYHNNVIQGLQFFYITSMSMSMSMEWVL